jgi:hypothetical protein
MKTSQLKDTFVLLALFVLPAAQLFAAPPPPPQAVPIDGGISLVIAGCVGYGAKKIHDRKKRK